MSDVPTAIDPQPDCAVDSKFLGVSSPHIELADRLLVQVIVRCISKTQLGKMTHACFRACTGVSIANSGDNWKN